MSDKSELDRIDLKNCPICNGIPANMQDAFIDQLDYKVLHVKKGEIIARQGDIVKALYLLVKGSVKTEMTNEGGQVIGIENMKAPRPLAPAFLFAESNRFPVDVTALEPSVIIQIPKEEVMKQLAVNPHFMQGYLKFNANRTQFLSEKLKLMTIRTIRGKLAYYLLHHTASGETSCVLDRNQTELAELFAVARPSLARTIAELEEEGIIRHEKKTVYILNRHALQQLI
ncbi:MAG: Crp/Fnr family transcriptional regulator [Bacteroidales bacterium]